mmetsp:Transcript_27997/g.32288  ORF Transcript_27997/g.32288 Transcript_27997/m.32288 type:complete len:108 (+) Transcript_27997:72-395(+)
MVGFNIEAAGLLLAGGGLGLLMLIKLAVQYSHPLWRLSVCGLAVFISTKLPTDLQWIIGMGGIPHLYEIIVGGVCLVCFMMPKHDYGLGDEVPEHETDDDKIANKKD